MVAFGFVFGFLLGIPVAVVDQVFHQWWLLPILGVLVGWATNALGMWLIFEPPEPRQVRPVHRPRAVPAPAGRGGRGVRRHHRQRRDHPRAHRRLPPRRPERRPHPPPAGHRDAARHRPGRRPGPCRGPGRGRRRALRQHPRRRWPRWRWTGPSARSGTRSSAASRPTRIRALVARRTKELPPRDFVEMMRAAIQRGRVDALRPRGHHGLRRWSPPPADLRTGGAYERATNGSSRCPASPGSRPAPRGARPGAGRPAATRRTGRLVLRTVTDPGGLGASCVEEVARDVAEAARTVSTRGPPDPGGYADRDGAHGGRPGPRGDAPGGRGPERDHRPEPAAAGHRATSARRGARPARAVPRRVGRGRHATRRSGGSSTTSRPTRPGSWCCWSRADPSPASTSAPAGRSAWSARSCSRPG